VTPAPSLPPRLGRALRLRKTAQFQAVYAFRARAGDERLAVYARPNGGRATRVGLSVGKRCGASAQRNRIKRLLREAFRHARAEVPAGLDVVLVPLGADYTLAEVRERLARLLPAAVRKAQRRAATPGDGAVP